MKHKTALAQTIDLIDLQQKKYIEMAKTNKKLKVGVDAALTATTSLKIQLQSLKPIERQQIENSYLVGLVDSHCKGASSKDYFNQNLTQE
jgi:hypothetical protein